MATAMPTPTWPSHGHVPHSTGATTNPPELEHHPQPAPHRNNVRDATILAITAGYPQGWQAHAHTKTVCGAGWPCTCTQASHSAHKAYYKGGPQAHSYRKTVRHGMGMARAPCMHRKNRGCYIHMCTEMARASTALVALAARLGTTSLAVGLARHMHARWLPLSHT